MSQHFGEHLTIDGYGGDNKALNDKEFIVEFLNSLLIKLDMHPLAEPQIVLAPDNGHKDPGGWSAFVMIVESHISIHTFPRRGFISADVYTCKNGMDIATIEQDFKKAFKLEELETHFIVRGSKYPSDNLHAA